jgi:DNA invertase Pin-like site-specific DNA recombinase
MVMTAKTIGYLRVSTDGQDLEKNKNDILKLANEKKLGHVDFVEERVSGKIHWGERKISQLIESLSKGDTIIVSELSRLSRSMLECMEILSVATKQGINIYAVKGDWVLDGSLQSKITSMVFSMAAEIERELITERTKEGLRHAESKGIKLGRPKGPGKSKLDHHDEEIKALLANGSTQRFIANRYNTTSANLCNWIKKHGLDNRGNTLS